MGESEGIRLLGKSRLLRKGNIRIDLKQDERAWIRLVWLRIGTSGIEALGFRKCGEFLDSPRNSLLLKKYCILWN